MEWRLGGGECFVILVFIGVTVIVTKEIKMFGGNTRYSVDS
jgi:hypothetical protein